MEKPNEPGAVFREPYRKMNENHTQTSSQDGLSSDIWSVHTWAKKPANLAQTPEKDQVWKRPKAQGVKWIYTLMQNILRFLQAFNDYI